MENFAVIYYDVLPKIWEFAGLVLATYAPARFSGEVRLITNSRIPYAIADCIPADFPIDRVLSHV